MWNCWAAYSNYLFDFQNLMCRVDVKNKMKLENHSKRKDDEEIEYSKYTASTDSETSSNC